MARSPTASSPWSSAPSSSRSPKPDRASAPVAHLLTPRFPPPALPVFVGPVAGVRLSAARRGAWDVNDLKPLATGIDVEASVGMVFQPDPPPDFQAAAAAEAGPLWNQWFRRKISLALTLSAAIPVLLLGYSIFGALMAWLGQD